MRLKPLHKIPLYTLALILIAFMNNLKGMPAERFENLSVKHGLSQNTIYDIAQDHDGFLWFATGSGLNRYDGKQFLVFSEIQSEGENIIPLLSNGRVLDIKIDDQNNLWLATQKGLNYLNPRTRQIKYFFHQPNNQNSLSNDIIRSVILDKTGNLWIATNDGLNRLDTKTDQIQRFHASGKDENCTKRLRKVIEDHTGFMWLGGNGNRVCVFDPEKKIFKTIDYQHNPETSINTAIRDVFQDSENNIWIGSIAGLYRFNPRTGESKAYRHNPNNSNSLTSDWTQEITEDKNRYLWIVTTSGINRLDKKTDTFRNYQYNKLSNTGPSWPRYFSVFIDRSELIWFGTDGSGIDKFNPRQDAFHLINDTGKPGYILSNPSVWAITNAYGYLWFGSSLGLNRYDITTRKIKQYFHNPNNTQNSLADDVVNNIIAGGNRDLWIATQNGLSYLNVDTEKFENFLHEPGNLSSLSNNIIITHLIDNKNRLWLNIYQTGISVFDLTQKKIVLQLTHDPNNTSSLRSNVVNTLEKAGDTIWISTLKGLDYYDTRTEQLHHYELLNNPSENKNTLEIISLKEYTNQRLLIGTPHSLIIHDRTSRKNIFFSKKDGLNDDHIYAIEHDKQGHIWISSNRGLSRINPETREIKNFDVSDGLQGYEFNGGSSFNDGNYLYFGGYNGVSYFIPETITLSTFIPPISITSIRINGELIQSHNFKDPIYLSYKENFFSIEFAALDFTYPEKNQYAYKLEGFDNDWIYSGNRSFASYTNLDGGNYQLRVKGSNKYGQWNEQGTSLAITIAHPPWKRWWAYLSYLLGAILVGFMIIRFKTLSDSRELSDNIRRMTTDLTHTLDLDMILFQLAQHLQQILPYTRIMIFLKQGDTFEMELDLCHRDKNQFPMPKSTKDNILKYTDEQRHPVFLVTTEDHINAKIQPEEINNNNLISLPLVIRKNMVGAILIMNSTQHNFRNDNINIAVTLSAHASAAIDNARLFEETKQLAFYDTLTGLENRRLFKERLEYALKTLERKNSDIALFFLDLDQFKHINDTLGHEAGDALLIEVGKRLSNCVRAQDTVARIGGDEFTILLNDVNHIKGASIIAEKILKVLESPVTIEGHQLNISTSIGISLAPKDSIDANILMKNADMAMYKAKEQGRNNYQFFTKEMNIQLVEHLTIKHELRHALEHNEFQLYYQPIYNMSTFQVEGAEALIRWIHPQRGLISPDVFIPRAEETYLIKDIGKWVFQEACEHLRYLQNKGFPPLVLSINLSVNQIMYDSQLVESIAGTLDILKINPLLIRLEITESILIKNIGKTIQVLHQLKNLGVSLAIDDFGTGYSSLSYLKQLPIDFIKVDRAFITGIPKDTEDTEITAAILAMAHKLQLKVVAEGVETREQLLFLEKNGCDFAQGYFFSKPIPLNQLVEFLESSPIRRLTVAE